MIRLDQEARIFCDVHGIPLERLFDASGYTASDFKSVMKDEDKWAAYGVRRCRRGHALRNRHNTCLMCDTQRVAYLLRAKMSGYLYVASGRNATLMKLGFSTNPANRIKIANYEGWGNCNDWCVRATGWAQEAGALEGELHAELQDIQVTLDWHRNGVACQTREAYLIDIGRAVTKLTWLCDSPLELVPPPW
jgi:hypothetical protein